MYRYEADMEMRLDPESLVGQYGIFYVAEPQLIVAGPDDAITRTRESVTWGEQDEVERYLARWVTAGVVPQDQEIEHITTVDDAERYADRERHAIKDFVLTMLMSDKRRPLLKFRVANTVYKQIGFLVN